MIFSIAAPITGFCIGLFSLIAALAMGALGGWLGARNRPPAQPQDFPYQPPGAPPPLSPSN